MTLDDELAGLPAFLVKSEAAKTLRVSQRTIERLIARTELIAFKVGGQTRIPRASIREYLLRNGTGPLEELDDVGKDDA